MNVLLDLDTRLFVFFNQTWTSPFLDVVMPFLQAKEAKYIKSFTLYVGGDEVYARDKADALEADLEPLVGGDIVTRMAKHDTNPANNPQPPERYRK